MLLDKVSWSLKKVFEVYVSFSVFLRIIFETFVKLFKVCERFLKISEVGKDFRSFLGTLNFLLDLEKPFFYRLQKFLMFILRLKKFFKILQRSLFWNSLWNYQGFIESTENFLKLQKNPTKFCEICEGFSKVCKNLCKISEEW